jgi:uncharacterized membrane protein
MIKIESSIVIERPVEQVFAFLADLENAPKWQSGLTDSTKLTDGAIGVGTKFREVIRIVGRPVETVCEITAYEPGRRMQFKSNSSKVIQYTVEYSFHAVGNDTRIEATGETQLGGLWRVIELLFAGEVKREAKAELQRLKEVLEAEPSRRPLEQTA